MQKMTGGCLCGRIRYSAEAESITTALCHCNMCQRQTGAAFSVSVGVPRAALNIVGHFKTFEGIGGSGKPIRAHFCGDCGSPIFNEVELFADVAWIKAGTLDDRSQLHPTLELWCETAQPWSRQPTQMQSFERMPV
jgi:hypothetical protein